MRNLGLPGCIHISEASYALLAEEEAWVATGGVEVKGKVSVMQAQGEHKHTPYACAWTHGRTLVVDMHGTSCFSHLRIQDKDSG